jgi:hypothetical protein
VAPESALAQYPYQRRFGQPPAGATATPYLNLIRRGNPAINYYGLVRPQANFQAEMQALQQRINSAQREIDARGETNGLPATGHPTYFMNYSHYYPAYGTPGMAPTGRPRYVPGPGRR